MKNFKLNQIRTLVDGNKIPSIRAGAVGSNFKLVVFICSKFSPEFILCSTKTTTLTKFDDNYFLLISNQKLHDGCMKYESQWSADSTKCLAYFAWVY